jgi:hypothetical protein
MGPIDLAMDVHGIGAADAALWIAERFTVPSIPARKRLADGNPENKTWNTTLCG